MRSSTPKMAIVALLLLAAGILAGCVTSPAISPQTDQAALQQQITSLEAEKAALEEQNRLLKELAGPLPASLDNYFPPKAQGPVWLLEMFALSGPLEGLVSDLQQQDLAGVQANYEAFLAQYTKVSEMVPEWKDKFPMQPVEALGEALKSGDPAQVGQALGQVGEVCGACHLANQGKAFAKYHWPDFGKVQVLDPVTGEAMVWFNYMVGMAGAFNGIGNDLQQGQLANARQNFQAFSARFKALEERGCQQCHNTPRAYFVDASIQQLVDQLGEALSADQPDPEMIGQLSGAIGNEGCMKCHLVHIPPTRIKQQWEAFADLLK